MVSVITCTIREQMLVHIIANFQRQTVEEKELIIILNKNDINVEVPQGQNIRVFQLDEARTLGECLNFGTALARYDVVAKFDDDDYYSPIYLANSLGLMKETKAGVVGKAAIFVYFKKEQLLALFRPQMTNYFVKKELLAGGTLIFKKEVWEKVPFRPLNVGEDAQFQKDCLARNISLYSGSFQDYVLIRYQEGHQHSWKVDDGAFQKRCQRIAVTEAFEDYVGGER